MIFTSTKNYLVLISFQVRYSWYNTSTQTFYWRKFTREADFFSNISWRWNHLHALEVNLHMLAADKRETCVHASQTCVHATLPLLFFEKKIREWNKKKTVHIKRPEQTCSVHCFNMYSDDGPGLIILSFGSRNRITESYYFIYTCTRFTIKNVLYFTLYRSLIMLKEISNMFI
jgi:hypothetical protein